MQAARLPLQWDRAGALRRPGHRGKMSLTREKAERARADSAAELIQQMKTPAVAAQYRAITARQLVSNTRGTLPSRQEILCRRISHHRAPKRLIVQRQPRAGSCSTPRARIVPFASAIWSGMGTPWHRPPADDRMRAGSPRHVLRLQRTRNGSRSRSTSKSQLQQLPTACSVSYWRF